MLFSQLQSTIAVPAIAALLFSAPGANAMPASIHSMVSAVKAVEARGFNGMGPVALFLAVKEYLKDANAYVCPLELLLQNVVLNDLNGLLTVTP
jgi:hypothetical protein